MEEDVEPKDEDGVDGRGVQGWDTWVGGLGVVGDSSIFGLVRRTGSFAVVLPTFVLVSRMQLVQQFYISVWVSVGWSSSLGHVFVQRIRVMGGCLIWVRWSPHRYLGGYVGSGLSLLYFRRSF